MAFGVTTSPMNTAVGILSAQVVANQSGLTTEGGQATTLGINSFRYDLFLPAAQGIDSVIIDKTDSINNKKTQFVSLGGFDVYNGAPIGFGNTTLAVAALNTLYGGSTTTQKGLVRLNFGSSGIFTAGQFVVQENSDGFGTIGFSTNGSFVIMSGILTSFNTTDDCSVGTGETFGGNSTVVGTPSSIDVVGVGSLFEDLTIVKQYPNLEPVNTNISSPFINVQYNELTTSNDGLGIANTFFQNGVDTGAGGSPLFSQSNFIGTVFAFSTTANAGAATSIFNIEPEIDSLRTGIGSDQSSTNIVKDFKVGYAVNVWTFEKNVSVAQSRITDLNNVIGILTDPTYGGPY